MLLTFTVENFRSYRDEKLFSLVATEDRALPQNLIDLNEPGFSVLRCAAIYGPNAAGKSNLIAAMNCLGELLQSPVGQQLLFSGDVPPFALDPTSSSAPTKFTVRFMLGNVVYEYLLAIKNGEVQEEKLSVFPVGRPQVWYHRKLREIEFNKTHLKGQKQSLRFMTPPGKPYLAIAAAFEHPQLTEPARWLAINLRSRLDFFESTSRYRRPEEITARRLHEDNDFRNWANLFLRHADLGIHRVDVAIEERIVRRVRRPTKTDEAGVQTAVDESPEKFYHPIFVHNNCEGQPIGFNASDESLGTRRLFSMLVPLYEVLKEGQLAVVDEFSASMHPSMVRELVRLFHDPKVNTKNAQLVFATHDATLLSGQLFRRDQIWFTEKDPAGATDLYSLQDIKGVREGEPFEKGYLRGRYGAIPFFGQFDFAETSNEATTDDDPKETLLELNEQDSSA